MLWLGRVGTTTTQTDRCGLAAQESRRLDFAGARAAVIIRTEQGKFRGARLPEGRSAAPGASTRGSRLAIHVTAPSAGGARRGKVPMAWLVLLAAGLMEVGWAVGLKYTEGFTRLWPSVGTVAAMVVSLALLGLALKTLPLGTAYAVWTGIGSVGTVLVGIWLLGESADPLRLGCIALILAGIVGLKLTAH